MKVLSLIKSHKIISALAIVIIVGATGGIIYATNQNNQEVKEVAKAQSTAKVTEPEPIEETKPVEKAKEDEVKKEDTNVTPQQTTQVESEPKYSATVPQAALDKAAEMQNASSNRNERYMTDIFWLYEEHPELLQADTYASTLAKMKTVYTSEKEPKSAMYFTLKLKEIF